MGNDEAWRQHYLNPPRSFVYVTNTAPPETITIVRSMLEDAAHDGVDIAPLCLSDVASGEWTRSGFDKRWTFTGQIGGEDKRNVCLSPEACMALASVVKWRERPMTVPESVARVVAIREIIEASAPNSTSTLPEGPFAGFTYRPPGRRLVFTVSARLTDDAMRQRAEDERVSDTTTRIVPVDETPEETAKRILGLSQ
jgi:hypothetical protein